MPAITKQDNVCLHDDSMPASMIRIIYDTMGWKPLWSWIWILMKYLIATSQNFWPHCGLLAKVVV